MSDDDHKGEEATLVIRLPGGADPSPRLRAALDGLSAALAAEEGTGADEVSGFEMGDRLRLDPTIAKAPGDIGAQQWGCIGRYYDPDTKTGSCMIQWD